MTRRFLPTFDLELSAVAGGGPGVGGPARVVPIVSRRQNRQRERGHEAVLGAVDVGVSQWLPVLEPLYRDRCVSGVHEAAQPRTHPFLELVQPSKGRNLGSR